MCVCVYSIQYLFNADPISTTQMDVGKYSLPGRVGHRTSRLSTLRSPGRQKVRTQRHGREMRDIPPRCACARARVCVRAGDIQRK